MTILPTSQPKHEQSQMSAGHFVPQGAMEKLKGAETVQDRPRPSGRQTIVCADCGQRAAWMIFLSHRDGRRRRLYAESAELSGQILMQEMPKVSGGVCVNAWNGLPSI